MVSRLESTAQSFEQKLAKIGIVINFPSANLSVKHPCFAPLEDLLMQRNMYLCVLKFRQNYIHAIVELLLSLDLILTAIAKFLITIWWRATYK